MAKFLEITENRFINVDLITDFEKGEAGMMGVASSYSPDQLGDSVLICFSSNTQNKKFYLQGLSKLRLIVGSGMIGTNND